MSEKYSLIEAAECAEILLSANFGDERWEGTEEQLILRNLRAAITESDAESDNNETFVADVRKFTEAAGCTTDEFNVRQTALYIGLQLEEMAEKLEAVLGYDSALVRQLSAKSEYFKLGIYDQEVRKADREALLDADIDLAWVTVGAALSSGADVLGAMKEVARSNFSKMVDGKMIKDANGKVIKGPDFSQPNLAPFIKNV